MAKFLGTKAVKNILGFLYSQRLPKLTLPKCVSPECRWVLRMGLQTHGSENIGLSQSHFFLGTALDL